MKLQVIVGSTRPGRVSDRIAKWVANQAKEITGAEVEVVDLADYALPFLDEAISPQYNPERKPEGVVKEWLDKVAEADGYVIVTPEYNRSYSAVLKNALDFLDFQFAKKPVALVAHGSTGGAQAVASLRITLPGVLAVTVPQAAFLLDRIGDKIDENGNATEALEMSQMAVKASLENLKWYAEALKPARGQQ